MVAVAARVNLRGYGRNMPCAANFWLPASRLDAAVGATVVHMDLTELDDRALAVLHEPGYDGVGRVVDAQGRRRRHRGCRRMHRDREREVDHRRGIIATTRVDAVEAVRQPEDGRGLQLADVVRRPPGVRVAAAAGPDSGAQRTSLMTAVIATSESSGGPGSPTLHAEPHESDRLCRRPVGVGRPDRQGVGRRAGGAHDGNASGGPWVRFGAVHGS